MKLVVIKRDGCRAPFDASLIAEAVARAAEFIRIDSVPMGFSVPSLEAICSFNNDRTIEDLELVPSMKGCPPYLFSLAKLLKVSCRQVRPP